MVATLLTVALHMTSFDSDSGRIVTRDGAGLHYDVRGQGRDTVIVPYGAGLMGPLEPLARGRTVIFYDMRGRGRSDPITDPARLGLEREIDDLDDVRAHFGLARVSLVGFSYLGGLVALYASRFPERVDRLVLLGGIGPKAADAPPGPDFGRLDEQRVARLQATFATADRDDPIGYCREYWATYIPLYVGGGRPTDGALALLQETCKLPNERPTAFLKVLLPISQEFQTVDLRAVGRAVRAPTLVLHGDSDHVAPVANARVWTEVIANARLELIHGAGHALFAEAPSEVIEHLDRFLPRSP